LLLDFVLHLAKPNVKIADIHSPALLFSIGVLPLVLIGILLHNGFYPWLTKYLYGNRFKQVRASGAFLMKFINRTLGEPYLFR